MRSPAPSIGSGRQSEVVMIEVYSFLAMFLVQILVMSVLYPFRVTRHVRKWLKSIPADRLAEHYAGVDVGRAHERFLTLYRTANTVVAVLGLLLLGWFFSDMKSPRWDEGRVALKLTFYFALQNFPLVLIAWLTTRFKKVHGRSSLESKRKAILQRRGLFDFVSPLTVVLAVLSYSLFAAFMFYVARDPFPGFDGALHKIGLVTLVFMLLGFMVYRLLYGRKTDSLQTNADRTRMIGISVNTMAWIFVVTPIMLALSTARHLFDLDSWEPLMVSVFFLTLGLLHFRNFLYSPLPQPEADDLASSTVRRPVN
jgi:hypothetical protein